MRSLLLTACCLLSVLTAQLQTSEAEVVKAPVTPEEVIEKYGSFEEAVFNMDRPEWAIMRTWEQYSEEEVIDLISARKNTPEKLAVKQARKMKRMMPPGDGCNCWVEPDETYTQITTAMWTESGGAGPDVDSWLGPITLGAGNQFSHYGTDYNSFYINSKGTVSFGGGYIDWNPTGFPEGTYNQIAGYWADTDIREQGSIYYKVTDEAVYVNFVDVDYFNATSGNHFSRSNSFQITFTPNGSDLLGDNNVQLCYLDMGWAHGDVGGNGGFNGPNPGVNGADLASTTGASIQFGRFNINNNNYDGPFGNVDGVNWLDNKQFAFSIASNNANIPPIASFEASCDTITVCLSDTLSLDMSFLSPEAGQITTITTNTVDGLEVVSVVDNNTALLEAFFVGSPGNLGVQDIVITATDDGDPAAVTELVITVEVIDLELPELTISGNLDICALETSLLTGSPGFEEYSWEPSGCDTQECEVSFEGIQTLSAFIGGCEAKREVYLNVTQFDLLDVSIESPICSNDSALIVIQDSEFYIEATLTDDFDSGGGEIYWTNEFDSAYVAPGQYQWIATLEDGCPRQRAFTVVGSDAALLPNDMWSGAYCDGVEPLIFDGGTGDEDCGNLTLYLGTSDPDGWGAGFLIVNIDGEQNILTSDGASVNYSLPICSGDLIEIEFISDGFDDENKTLTLFNCNNTLVNVDLVTDEIIYSEIAGCEFEIPAGSWEITDGPTGTFSVTDQFNTTFTPDSYGLYTLTFTDAACFIDYVYSVEYNEEPTLALQDDSSVLCPGESFTAVVTDSYDPGGTGILDFPNGGPTYGPYNGYEYLDMEVSFSNGCGEATAPLLVQALVNPIPSIDDEILCDGGTLTLSAVDNPTPDMVFVWSIDGEEQAEDGNEFTVEQSGSFLVSVSNECFPIPNSDDAEIQVGALISDFLPEFTIDCNGNGNAFICPQGLPANSTITWPDNTTGTTGDCWETTSEGIVEISVTDDGDCATVTDQTEVQIDEEAVANASSPTTVILCPEIENVMTISSNSDFFTWFIECPGSPEPIIPLSEVSNSVTITSSMIPQDCWGGAIVTGTAQSNCGNSQVSFNVAVDACEIIIPNIFTPHNQDNLNDDFVVDGLDVYKNVSLRVFNRWGNLVYESDDYKNGEWSAKDESEGTYFYVLILENGIEHTGTVLVKR